MVPGSFGTFRAYGLDVGKGLFMRKGANFHEVVLRGAKIGGNLEASGSQFHGKFNGDSLEVSGSIFMRNGAKFQDISLSGAQIGHHLQLQGSAFAGTLDLTGAVVKEDFLLLKKGKIPTWKKTTDGQEGARLILRNTVVGAAG